MRIHNVVSHPIIMACLLGVPVKTEAFSKMADSPTWSVRTRIELAIPTLDMIELLPLSNNGSHAEDHGVVAVVKRGNIAKNVQEYTMLYWEARDLKKFLQNYEVKDLPQARVLARFETRGAFPAISNLVWSPRDRTLLFLGTDLRVGDLSQVYGYNFRNTSLTQYTKFASSILSFDYAAAPRKIVFTSLVREDLRPLNRFGFTVGSAEGGSRNSLDVVAAPDPYKQNKFSYFSIGVNGGQPLRIASDQPQNLAYDEPENPMNLLPVYISPSGRWAIRAGVPSVVPRSWKAYPWVRKIYPSLDSFDHWGSMEEAFGGTASNAVLQYVLMDLVHGTSRPLVDMPIKLQRGFRSPEIEESTPVIWDEDHSKVTIAGRSSDQVGFVQSDNGSKALEVDYEGSTSAIVDRKYSAESTRVASPWFRLASRGDRGSLAEVHVSDLMSGRAADITHLNGDLSSLQPKIEEYSWASDDRKEYRGKLLIPPNCSPKEPCPLVLWTYGGTPTNPFLMTNKTALPARSLASRGIAVAVISSNSRNGEIIKSFIYSLRRNGTIDTERIGIIGFSAKGNEALYLATAYPEVFSAVAIVDSSLTAPWSYFEKFGRPRPGMAEFDSDYAQFGEVGAQLIGAGVDTWVERSPFFHLDQIRAPILFESHKGAGYIPECWDVYTVLKRAERPVELNIYPYGTHNLERPLEQFFSQQSLVDWFAFWLKGEERLTTSPGVPETRASLESQYARWRILREQQVRHLLELDAKAPN